jgi:hypothetical protein
MNLTHQVLPSSGEFATEKIVILLNIPRSFMQDAALFHLYGALL